MLGLSILLVFIAIVLIMLAVIDDNAGRNVSSAVSFLLGLVALIVGLMLGFKGAAAAGAIAHASGKVTATRIDHGDRVEWKVEAVKEPRP